MSGRVTPIPEKLGKIVDALRWPSKGPTISAKFVEKVIGHCIHFMMLRRELLAIFRSLYQFVHDNYWHRRRLWPWARSEANWAAVCWQSRLLILDILGTARFLHRMLHFLVSVFASLIFHMMGNFKEAWRYKTKAPIAPRKATVSHDGITQGLDSFLYRNSETVQPDERRRV